VALNKSGAGRPLGRREVASVEGGSAGEQEYADSMTGDYLKAVEATLGAMRRIAADASSVST
jgi:hypothetical protein